MQESQKRYEIQKDAVSRLSPEPGSKVGNDPIAAEVHKHRMLQRASSRAAART